MKRTFIYTDDKSSKFWAIETDGVAFTVTFGKTGTDGQKSEKSFASDAECQKAADKLIAEKTKKGYVEQFVATASPAVADTVISTADLELVKAQLTDVSEDNDEVVKVVNAIADSGNIDEQKAVVQTFIAAYYYYDAGHRGEMLETLIDKIFPKFKAEPLADLLEWCPPDMLMYDYIDALFAPALSAADEAVKNRLFNRLSVYYKEAVDYSPYTEKDGQTYFRKFFDYLDNYFTPEQKEHIEKITIDDDNPSNIKKRIAKADTAGLEALIKAMQPKSKALLDDIQYAMDDALSTCTDINPLSVLEWYCLLRRNGLGGGSGNDRKEVLYLMTNCQEDFEKALENIPQNSKSQMQVCDDILRELHKINMEQSEYHCSDEQIKWLMEKCAMSAALCGSFRKDDDTVEKIIQGEVRLMLRYSLCVNTSYFDRSAAPTVTIHQNLLQKAYSQIDKMETLPFSLLNYSDIWGNFGKIVDILEKDKSQLKHYHETLSGFLYRLPKLEYSRSACYYEAFQKLLSSGLKLAQLNGDEKLETFLRDFSQKEKELFEKEKKE
jgi:predicted DNA-binding WGR domain protein